MYVEIFTGWSVRRHATRSRRSLRSCLLHNSGEPCRYCSGRSAFFVSPNEPATKRHSSPAASSTGRKERHMCHQRARWRVVRTAVNVLLNRLPDESSLNGGRSSGSKWTPHNAHDKLFWNIFIFSIVVNKWRTWRQYNHKTNWQNHKITESRCDYRLARFRRRS